MSLASLSEAIRKELTTLGIPTVLEMAVVSSTGKVLYTDLSKAAMQKVSPFYDSLLMMGQGDNLSLALDTNKTIVASRVSNKAILVVITDKKIGIVLTKMSGVADKFGRLLDELVTLEESKAGAEVTPSEALAVAEPAPPAPPPIAEEVEPPSPTPPPAPAKAKAKPVAISPPPTPTSEAAPSLKAPVRAEAVSAARKLTERVIVPSLTDLKALEKCPEKERRFLELFDGNLSLNEIAKRLKVPFFDALQVANKYKSMGKVDMTEVIRG